MEGNEHDLMVLCVFVKMNGGSMFLSTNPQIGQQNLDTPAAHVAGCKQNQKISAEHDYKITHRQKPFWVCNSSLQSVHCFWIHFKRHSWRCCIAIWHPKFFAFICLCIETFDSPVFKFSLEKIKSVKIRMEIIYSVESMRLKTIGTI